jgi:hypothetical protein
MPHDTPTYIIGNIGSAYEYDSTAAGGAPQRNLLAEKQAAHPVIRRDIIQGVNAIRHLCRPGRQSPEQTSMPGLSYRQSPAGGQETHTA